MNAAASGLIDAIKASYNGVGVPTGTDWDYIPSGATSWYKFGGGGINSWGTVCGVPNGAIAVLNLMNLHATFAEQIMLYMCQTEFPMKGLHDQYVADAGAGWAKEPVPDDEVLAYTTADNPLCHASVSKWAYAAGVSMAATTPYSTAHKTDRCAKVAAAGAAFTAELLNGVTSGLTIPVATAACMTCHSTTTAIGIGATGPGQQGKMDCQECHKDFSPHTTTGTSPETPSITVNVKYDGGTPIEGATVYLKQKKEGSAWKQIYYGYTDSSGSKTFANLTTGSIYLYQVVVYKYGVDFNGAKPGKQTKVKFENTDPKTPAFELTGNATIDITQGVPGSPPTIAIAIA